ELLGGFAIFIRALVPLMTVLMIAVPLVAPFTVHLQSRCTSIKLIAATSAGPQFGSPGSETDVLYLACLVTLVFGGAGPFAVDGLLPWRKASKSSSTVCMSATGRP